MNIGDVDAYAIRNGGEGCIEEALSTHTPARSGYCRRKQGGASLVCMKLIISNTAQYHPAYLGSC